MTNTNKTNTNNGNPLDVEYWQRIDERGTRTPDWNRDPALLNLQAWLREHWGAGDDDDP